MQITMPATEVEGLRVDVTTPATVFIDPTDRRGNIIAGFTWAPSLDDLLQLRADVENAIILKAAVEDEDTALGDAARDGLYANFRYAAVDCE